MRNSINPKISVEEFTTPDPQFVSPDDNIKHIKSLMKHGGYRHILVAENNKAIGIISERDVYKALLNNKEKAVAQDIMSKNLYRVQYTENIEEVSFTMSDRKIGSAVVEDEQGDIYGIFTATDALNALVEILRK